jgi:hypothetical protein
MLYHAEPSGLTGERLVPLSALAVTDPAAYAAAIATYADTPERRRMPDRRVPLLDCRWQDVVFLAPVHPHLIWRAWAHRGVYHPGGRFLAIPAKSVAHIPAVVYTPDRTVPGEDLHPADVRPFDAETYTEMTALSERTLAWYDTLAAAGRSGGLFHTVPHVLVRGRVDIGDAEVVDWRHPPVTG